MERNFFVLEDRVYADASFDGEPVRSLRELAPAHVIYVNSLSKVVGGGLRAGWVAARGPVRERIATLKLESDFHTATLIQHIAARWLATGAYDQHVEQHASPSTASGATRCWRRSSGTCPASTRPTRPQGGHHVWVTLTRPLDERALYTEAARHGVAFTPGRRDHGRAPHADSFRLSFSLLDPPELDEGVGGSRARSARCGAARGTRWPRRCRRAPGFCRTSCCQSAERTQLVAREAAQEQPADPVEVGLARRARRARRPSRRDLREQAARVALAALAPQEPLALEPVHQPRQAAAAEQHRVGELGHAHAALVGVVQEQEHLVGRERQVVLARELGVELPA